MSNQNFKYDALIIIDENIIADVYSIKKEIKNTNKKFLAIIIDYKNYSLKEKNIIKSYSDDLNLDILMFTLRSEFKKIIKKKDKDFASWKKIIKLNWIFYCLDIYEIPEAYLNNNLTQNLNFKYTSKLDLFFKIKKLINKKIGFLKKKFHENTYSFLNLINKINSENISNKNIHFFKKYINKIPK